MTRFELHASNLSSADELHIDVGIAASRIHAVLAEVFTDVFWCCLRKQPIQTLPEIGKNRRGDIRTELWFLHCQNWMFINNLALTSQPEPLKGCCPEPSCEPSRPRPWLPGSPELFLFPLARMAKGKTFFKSTKSEATIPENITKAFRMYYKKKSWCFLYLYIYKYLHKILLTSF